MLGLSPGTALPPTLWQPSCSWRGCSHSLFVSPPYFSFTSCSVRTSSVGWLKGINQKSSKSNQSFDDWVIANTVWWLDSREEISISQMHKLTSWQRSSLWVFMVAMVNTTYSMYSTTLDSAHERNFTIYRTETFFTPCFFPLMRHTVI